MNLNNLDLDRIQKDMTASARRILNNSQDVEDIVQDSLLELVAFESEDSIFGSSAYDIAGTIARRNALDFVRKEGRRREIEQDNGDAINRNLTDGSAELLSADPFDLMIYEEAQERLDALSPLLYETLMLHHVDGWPVDEIAQSQGTTPQVIYKRLQRAKDIVAGDNNDD